MKTQHGQVMLEFLVLGLALCLALLAPVDAGRPIAVVLLEALIGFLQAQAFVLSVV